MRGRLIKLVLVWLGIAALAGCANPALTPLPAGISPEPTRPPITPSINTPTPDKTATQPLEASPEQAPELTVAPADPIYGYTHQRADGNRLAPGSGGFPETIVIDIPLGGTPAWLVAAPGNAGGIWVVALEDGRVQAFSALEGGISGIEITPKKLPRGMPPLLEVLAGQPRLVTPPTADASPLTAAAALDARAGRLAYIAQNGDLVVWERGEVARLAVNALPDARLLVDERRRILFLSEPTSRYDHSVLGDGLEAASITLVETEPGARVLNSIHVDPPGVFEGIAPIWADLNGDGEREIIATRSDAEKGAQVVVFNEIGEMVASGPSIGRGYRWRNQLSIAPFGPDGELEMVDVLTPHIGGVVEFYRLADARLEIYAQVSGYTSHVIGTRNLDMALSGDFNGDGRPEVVLPTQSLGELAAIQHAFEGAQEVWRLPIGGLASTNLSAIALSGGGMALGVGREDGVLRVWVSR